MIFGKHFGDVDPTEIPVDTEYQQCNFSRTAPIDVGGGVMQGTRLFPGDDTPRTFVKCNLTNCETPPGSTVVECNTKVIDTRKFTRRDAIVIDGVDIGGRDFHDIIEYGRFNPDTEAYDHLPVPLQETLD